MVTNVSASFPRQQLCELGPANSQKKNPLYSSHCIGNDACLRSSPYENTISSMAPLTVSFCHRYVCIAFDSFTEYAVHAIGIFLSMSANADSLPTEPLDHEKVRTTPNTSVSFIQKSRLEADCMTFTGLASVSSHSSPPTSKLMSIFMPY